MAISDKFQNVGIEEDTRVLSQKVVSISGISALYQKWSWEGIRAESLIFEEVDVAHLTDEELMQLAISAEYSDAAPDEMTVKRSSSGYAFVNFNFEY